MDHRKHRSPLPSFFFFLPPWACRRRPPPRWRRRGLRLKAASCDGIGGGLRRRRPVYRKCCSFPLARASAWEVGELPRKSSPGPPPAADMAVDSSMELLFLDTFKHPSAEVRPRDPISTRPLSTGTPAAESGVVRAVSSLSRARRGVSSGPHPLPQPGASPVALGGGSAFLGFDLGPAASVESAALLAVLSCQH